MRPKHQQNIKSFLLEGHSITPIIAENKFHCHRLSAVIHRLRKEGMNIITTMCYEDDADGEMYCFAKYKLIDSKKK